MECDVCGKTVRIGEWPFCPHGSEWTFGEDPMESYIDEHLTSEPGGIEITTRGQRRKIMDENKFEYRKKAPRLGDRLFFDMGKG